MKTIEDYLKTVFGGLKQSVDESASLYQLKDFRYNAGHVPDYSNLIIQQYYILKYTYSYANEYMCIYMHIFNDMQKNNINLKNLKVLSLGCGNNVDYYSVASLFEHIDNASIDYIGVDLVNWSYKFDSRRIDNVNNINIDMADYIKNLDSFDFDIMFLPKSISEIDDKLKNLCDAIINVAITKDMLYFAVPLRNNGGSEQRDWDSINEISKAIASKGFKVSGENTTHSPHEEFKDKKIRELRPDYTYPKEIIDYLLNLSSQCGTVLENFKPCSANCKNMNQFPMLKFGNLKFAVLKFERNNNDN